MLHLLPSCDPVLMVQFKVEKNKTRLFTLELLRDPMACLSIKVEAIAATSASYIQASVGLELPSPGGPEHQR